MSNLTIFDMLYEDYKITKPIRLIEFFAGYGSQAFALKYLGANFEHHRICEWAVPSIQAYKDAHFTNDNEDYSKDLSKDELVDYLFNKGISMDYNQPMKFEQIKRLKEEQLRTIYNNIMATHNLVNIQQAHGKDLEIVDKDKYEYILTYSFPCQDLSLAGLGKGMSRDGGTRSGMLWEVERILDECNELGTLPNLLLMENVPQVIGSNAIKDFQSWRDKLESLGYSNYIEILNAKNYGIPQNRERAFMVSILGEYNYTFPQKFPLEKKLKYLLEKNVDEKYYLSDKQINQVIHWEAQQEPFETLGKPVSPTLTTRSGAYAAGMVLTSDLEQNEEMEIGQELLKIKEATKKGYKEAYEGDGIDIGGRMETLRGTVQKGMAQTIKTSIDVGVVVKEDNLKTKLCNDLIASGKVKENDVIRHSYSSSRMKEWENRNIELNNMSPTLDTRCDCLGVVVKDEDDYVGTYNYVKSDNFMQGKDRFQPGKEISSAILAGSPPEAIVTKETNEPKVLGGLGEKKSNGGTQWYQQDRIYDDNVAISVTTSFHPYYSSGLRIRKLVPKECGRLMGLKDKDIMNIISNQTDAKAFHLFGDSIVVNCLYYIFKQLL